MPAPCSGLRAANPAGPRTPEPTAAMLSLTAMNAHPPSPPRPRLRLRRRTVSRLSAPTQNFLASVAAADVPIPSIEVSDQEYLSPGSIDLEQQSRHQKTPQTQLLFPTDSFDANFLSVRGRGTFSPPKTPIPDTLPSSSLSRFPDWSRMDSVFSSSAESSPDREYGSSSRPSTARSTQTSSSSLFSRFSMLSEDEHRISPEDEACSRKKQSLGSRTHELRRNSASGSWSSNTVYVTNDDKATASRKNPARRAPWTNAMNAHLWATFLLYLQDPRVTPFRVGRSCIPPHGVLVRVAREAKRSWKGAKVLAKASARNAGTNSAAIASSPAIPPSSSAANVSTAGSSTTVTDDSASKSGSSTPTAAESSQGGTFMKWPFTNAATRAQLRELCRKKAATPGSGARGLQYMSRSSTPYADAAAPLQHNGTRDVHGPSASSSFATQDMVFSLALSTSEAMKPQGPLAQLTRSGSNAAHDFNTALPQNRDATAASATESSFGPSLAASQSFTNRLASAIDAEEAADPDRRRLGSPFTTQSYGPSSSNSLATVLGLTTSSSRQPHTMGPRRSLQSPVRLSRSGTQKRRTKHLSQDLKRRPGLASDFFTEPLPDFAASLANLKSHHAASKSHGSTLSDDLFIPKMKPASSLTSSSSAPQLVHSSTGTTRSLDHFVSSFEPDFEQSSPPVVCKRDLPGLLDTASLQPPARLGSPFPLLPGSSTSFSFPNRFTQPTDLDLESIGRPFATVHRAPAKPAPPHNNLASRLAYIDQRLRELNSRNENRIQQPDSAL